MFSLQATLVSPDVQFLGTNQADSRCQEERTFVLENKFISLKACQISLAVVAQVKFRWLSYKMRTTHLMKCIKGVDLCELPPWCIEFTEQHTIVQGSERTVFTQLHRCPFKEQAVNWLKREKCAERPNSERYLRCLSQAGWICSPHGCCWSCSHYPLQTLNATPCPKFSIFMPSAPLQTHKQ